jgi:GDSL-like Lipase/Acylhydrolase family
VNVSNLVKNALLLAAVLVAGLGLLELAVRLFVPVRNVGPSFTTYDPEYGKQHKPSFTATRYTPEFTMSFSTNALGFRGPEEGDSQRGVILFLGDSFTEGYGVSDGEEFPALVGERLRARGAAVSVLNGGIGDNGNGRWIKFLRAAAASYEPQLVVLQVHVTDFWDNLREGLFQLTGSGELEELPVPPKGWARRLQTVIEAVPGLPYSHLIGLLRELPGPRAAGLPEADRARTAADRPAPGSSYRDRLTQRLIEEAVRICARSGWPVLGLLVDLDPAHAALLERLFVEHGADVIVLPTKDEMPELYYAIDGHWRPAGHRLAARMLIEQLSPYLDRGR